MILLATKKKQVSQIQKARNIEIDLDTEFNKILQMDYSDTSGLPYNKERIYQAKKVEHQSVEQYE